MPHGSHGSRWVPQWYRAGSEYLERKNVLRYSGLDNSLCRSKHWSECLFTWCRWRGSRLSRDGVRQGRGARGTNHLGLFASSPKPLDQDSNSGKGAAGVAFGLAAASQRGETSASHVLSRPHFVQSVSKAGMTSHRGLHGRSKKGEMYLVDRYSLSRYHDGVLGRRRACPERRATGEGWQLLRAVIG